MGCCEEEVGAEAVVGVCRCLGWGGRWGGGVLRGGIHGFVLVRHRSWRERAWRGVWRSLSGRREVL